MITVIAHTIRGTYNDQAGSLVLLRLSWRPWEFAGMGFRIIAVIFFEASISASDRPVFFFAWAAW